MKKTVFVFVLVFVIGLSGCGFLRRSALKISEEDLKNAEVARVIAKNCLSTWGINSGFIRAALGDSLDKLPLSAIKAMAALDGLVEKQNELTDFEVGYTLGFKITVYSGIVKKALKEFAPGILKLLPFALP